MKFFFTLCFLLAGLVEISSAQSPNWLWAKSSTGGNYEYGFGLSLDNAGHLFISGRITGGVTFGGVTATAPALNPFEAEFDLDGNGIWFQTQFYTSGNDYPGGFFRDVHNNTYGTGIRSSSQDGMYVEKRNSAGTMQPMWPVKFTGTQAQPAGLGVTADVGGNVYLTGAINPGVLTMNNSITVTNSGSGEGAYVAKLDSNGKAIWAKPITPLGGTVVGRDIITDNEGNLYVIGEYTGTPTFGTYTAPASVGFYNFFIAKYDTAGNFLTLKYGTRSSTAANGAPEGAAESIIMDSCHNIYVTGQIQGMATFGNFSVSSVGGNDMFLAKLDKDENWQWVSSAGSAANDMGLSLALDKNNEIYVGGDYGGAMDFGNGVTIGGNGGLYVAKYSNSTGVALWAQYGLGSTSGHMEGLDVDRQGYVYVIGDYTGTATFGSSNIAAVSASNILLAKLDTVTPRTIVPTVQTSYCPGSSGTIPYTINGTFNNGNVFTVELSDSTGSFITFDTLGSVASTTGGVINITIPANVPPANTYLIRVISSNPATSSYVNGCGAYFANNVYPNVSYITIGGGLNAKVTPTDTTVCSASAVQLTATGGSTYTWQSTTGLSCGTCANPVATPQVNTTYVVNISSGGSCPPVNDTVVINVNPSAPLVITSPTKDTSICFGVSVQLAATGAGTFAWSPKSSLTDSTIANPLATPQSTTTYVVTGGACTTPAQVVVTVGNNAVGGAVTAVRDTICSGTPGNLVLTGNSSNTIIWQSSLTGTGGYAPIGPVDTSKYKTDPLTQSTWFRAIVGSGACLAASDSLELVVPPTLTASFTSTANVLTVTFNSSGSIGNINNYFWDFGDGFTSNDSNPTHTYAKDTVYNPCLTIYDGSNCSYTFCRSIALGVPTISAGGNWSIYPNPFGSELNIETKTLNSHVQSIQMFDVLGRVMVSEVMGNANRADYQLNVSSLAKGMYYLMVRTTDADYVQKVVKQ